MLAYKRSIRTAIICNAAAHGLRLRLFFCVGRLKDEIDLIHIPAPRRNALVRLVSEPRKTSYAHTTCH
jgi:hypothetical protein